MAFGNYYNPYQPGAFPMPQAQYQPQANSNIVWVPNVEAAMSDPLGPNQAKAYWDTYQPKVYVRKTDASGRPEMTTYTITADAPQTISVSTQSASDYVTRQELSALTARLEALEGVKVDAK